MNGVTKQIFFLPVPTKMKGDTKIDNNCFKGYLERVFPKDLDTWRDVVAFICTGSDAFIQKLEL